VFVMAWWLRSFYGSKYLFLFFFAFGLLLLRR
jgi:hypothetical protein